FLKKSTEGLYSEISQLAGSILLRRRIKCGGFLNSSIYLRIHIPYKPITSQQRYSNTLKYYNQGQS
ncbi:unnamed protein product, partial [Ceratitis capitata]